MGLLVLKKHPQAAISSVLIPYPSLRDARQKWQVCLSSVQVLELHKTVCDWRISTSFCITAGA